MRAFVFGLLAALAAVSWAKAYDFEETGQWASPRYELLKAKWPHEAAGGLIYGKVLLDCGVGANGFATDCKVKASEPSNPAFERAALELAPLYKARDPKVSRALLEVSVRYDEKPDWLRRPSLDDMEFVWPRSAAAAGMSGRAMLKCIVNKQGLLQDCTVKSQEPAGWGFGEAALMLTPTMLFKPATLNGQPTDAEINFPLAFVAGGSFSPRNSFLVPMPSWSKSPNAAEVMAQLEKKVGDRFADGKVVFLCSLNQTTGKLERCKLTNASRGMGQFRDVGEALTEGFQASPDAVSQVQRWFGGAEALVFLPFSFPDMTSAAWSKHYLSHVLWTNIPGPSPGHPLFPKEAVEVGIKEGVAAVDCVVADNGSLHDCSVTGESSPGVGFGAMAKTIAEASTINPWTEEGLPAGGARVRVPIQMTYDPRFTTAATGSTPATKP
jgi:TonB family protein